MGGSEGYLETGHGPTTPLGDTLLRRWLVNLETSLISQVGAMGGRHTTNDVFSATDLGRPAVTFNWATLRRPLIGLDLAGVLGEIETFFRIGDPAVSGTVFLYSAWPTPDLRPFGWTLSGHPPLMLLPAGHAAPPPPAELRIEEVHDSSGMAAAVGVLIPGFSLSEAEAATVTELMDERFLSDRRQRFWVGWKGAQPICTAGSFADAGVTQVLAVATLPEERGRGYGAAITWAASRADPALPAMLFPSDVGRPVYERMGYLSLFRATLWYRPR